MEEYKFQCFESSKEQNKIKATQFENKTKDNIIIFSDYDGTLVDFYNNPEDAVPSNRLLDVLCKISELNFIEFVLISGRDKKFLQKHFGHINGITLVAEYGAFIKESKHDEWIHNISDADSNWKEDVNS